MRSNNTFKCFRTIKKYLYNSGHVKWNDKRVLPDSGKTDDEIDKLKSLRSGLRRVDAHNLSTHPGSPSGPGA